MTKTAANPREALIISKALVNYLEDEMFNIAEQATEAVRLLAGDFAESDNAVIRGYIKDLVAAHNELSEQHARAVKEMQDAREALAS
jgi:hypothetical protein